MSEDRAILICSPVDRPAGVPGAVQVRADCGHTVWLSPSGLQMQLAGVVKELRCEDCIDAKDVMEVSPGPGQREELRVLLGDNVADQLIVTATADPQRMIRTLQGDNRRRRRGRR